MAWVSCFRPISARALDAAGVTCGGPRQGSRAFWPLQNLQAPSSPLKLEINTCTSCGVEALWLQLQ